MAIPYGSSSTATQTSFLIKLDAIEQNNSRFLDVGQCLSLINRKLMRQLQLYPVQVEMAYDSSVSNNTEQTWRIECAPNTYMVRQALKFAFENWLAATADARKMTKEARWMDFKLFYNDFHYDQGSKTSFGNLLPNSSVQTLVDYSYSAVSNTMQWLPTIIDSPDTGVDMHYQLFGETDSDEFGILHEYLKSYKLNVASPDPAQFPAPLDTPYEDAFAQLSEEASYLLASRGASPPYDADNFQINLQTFWIGIQNMISAAGVAATPSYMQRTSTPWFIAPAGLIQITNQASTTHTGILRVNVLHGKDKGINTGDI